MTVVPDNLSILLGDGEFTGQRAFTYPAAGWTKWTGHLDGVCEVLSTLPSAIDRRHVSTAVENLLPNNVTGAFAVAMVWGYGTSNLGPPRTARILTQNSSPRTAPISASVLDRLAQSVAIARRDGAVEGYRYLNNRDGAIAGLGPAFFTKWLYFVTARGDSAAADAAPVLDALILRWLRTYAGIHLRRGRTADYRTYIELLETWGEPYQLTAVQVEERIFDSLTSNRTG